MYLWLLKLVVGFVNPFKGKFLAYGLIGLGFAMVTAAFFYEKAGWERALVQINAEQAKNFTLQDSLESQSKQVADLAAAMKRRQAASQEALGKAKAGAMYTEQEVTALLTKAVNSDFTGACKAADQSLLELR